jgi:hypothetical protein
MRLVCYYAVLSEVALLVAARAARSTQRPERPVALYYCIP